MGGIRVYGVKFPKNPFFSLKCANKNTNGQMEPSPELHSLPLLMAFAISCSLLCAECHMQQEAAEMTSVILPHSLTLSWSWGQG